MLSQFLLMYGECAGRRAPHGRAEARRAPPPHDRALGSPRRAPPSMRLLPLGNFPRQGGARGPSAARRARAFVHSAPSNKRLKLAGALVLKEAVVSCPVGHGTCVHHPCAGERVARSFTAIR